MNEKNNDSVKIEEPEMEKKENEGECSTKKRTKEDKSKKKEDKRPSEQYLKILSHVSSPEDKLDVMCKKYSQVLDENRRLSLALKHSEKKVELLLREREQLQIERSKSIMTRKRLENLCRELQKQNKIVKNESLQRVKEQEEIRKDLSEKFQGGLAQITTLMNQNIEKNAKMYEENLEINKKFKAVYEQVEQKEQQLLKVHQQMKIDLQIADAKLAKVKMEATAEKEALLKEKQQLLLKITEYQTQIKELQATEVGLRSEISMYTDKYDEFQNALNRSNKIYGEFNVEMEKMTKKLYMLEKETSLWKQRWANSHDALLAMAADKQTSDGEIAMLSKKLTLLQDLCKMFQCERTKLLAQLKAQDNKAPPPEASSVPTESQEVTKYMKQMDELPNLENTFEQLQASLANVTEAMRNGSDVTSKAATTKSVNGASTKDQKQDEAKVKLDEKNEKIERLQATSENADEKSSKSNISSNLNDGTTKQSNFHVDSVTLNYMAEAQEIENADQGSLNTTELTITEITDEKLDELEDMSKPEEVNDFLKLQTELSKTKEINEENNTAEAPEDAQVNDKSDVVENEIDLKETNDDTEVKQNKISEQSPELSKMVVQVPDTVGSIPLQVADLSKEKEVDLLQNNTNNYANEESKSQTNENEDKNSRTYQDVTSETTEENKGVEISHTNLNVDHDETLVNSTQNSQDATVESNIEAVSESINNSEHVTESSNSLIKNISEVLKTDDETASKDEMTKEKFTIAAETASKVDKSNSELTDNTINDHMTNDALLGDETSKSEAKTTCTPVTKNVTSSKDITKIPISENDYAEEKLNKPAHMKKRRKK